MQFLRFCMTGGVGFLIDYIILCFLSFYLDLYISRGVSFSISLIVTWFLNAKFTFGVIGVETFMKYISSSLVGGGINYLFFIITAHLIGASKGWTLILPIALGSFAALFFNFFCSKFYVFSEKR